MTIREIAEAALADILSKPKGLVRSSRRGVVAASTNGDGMAAVFRREGKRVHLELWPTHGRMGDRITEHPLPADLERAAGRMLDDL